jgi:hypothetical protein
MRQLRKISSHSQWQSLQEVWIGGTYPTNFYRHLGSQTHELFSQITEITEKDFDCLDRVLRDLGVTIIRPKFDKIDDYLDEQDHLLKPPISPCDIALTLGETLYLMPQYPSGVSPYQHAIDDYIASDQKIHVIDRSIPEPWAGIVFASVVRAGRDILIDYDLKSIQSRETAVAVSQQLSQSYRVHLSTTGDHNDGVFCPLRPGHLLTSHYRKVYDQSFPDWCVYHLPNSLHKNIEFLGTWRKWYIPGIDYGHFNQHIVDVAKTWIGNPQETVFEVNILVVDEHNIICGAYDEEAFRYLESLGITAHLVDFKSRYFWDAGIHCVTSDIHRVGSKEDYWPNRGPNGIYQISEW